jgi:peptide/nickel transport system permease protein
MIVAATLAIPGMILGETALSFLGLGIQSPMVSWGVLLKQAQDITVLAHKPWLIAPVFFLAIAVLSFNFLGDGLRDAADPFSGQ